MATIADGNYLNQYVAPQLLAERRNFKDDFMGVLGSVPAQALSADGVKYNKLINNVGFLVNNTAEFTAKAMAGKKVFVPWEKYDTEPTSVDDSEVRALAYDKRNIIRVKHNEAFQIGIRNHVLNKLAPSDATNAAMPVMRTTGADDGTRRKRLTFADLAKYLETVKLLNLAVADQLYIVLCPAHVTDLIIDKDAATYFIDRSLYIDPISGKVRSFMGFKFYENNDCPYYSSATVKKAVGAVAATGDQQASVFFYAPNTLYHLESVKILYSPETTDTKSADPTSIFRTQTYGLVDRIEDYGCGAIISANVA
jgi:hypothetical protein